MQSRTRKEQDAEHATLRLVQDHAAELLRFARRFSHCTDDAHDAYQRALEILVRRMRVDPPAQPLSWLRTVLRHEALAIRAERERLLGRNEVDLDRHEDRAMLDPAERAVGYERLRHAAEALQRLKPQEVTALVLRGEGLSYAEICERMGWTYTRVNRTVTEGRRALLERLGAIESGAECERWLPLLSMLADGEATAADLTDLRPHLRACPACRATLRDFHAAPAQVALLVPPALLATVTDGGGGLAGQLDLGLQALLDRATLLITRVQGAFEALPGTKLAAVAASTAAIASGGVALERVTDGEASGAGASRASRVAVVGSHGGLTPVAFPTRVGRAVPERRERPSAPSHGEFAGGRVRPPEFTAPSPRPAEFAASAYAVAPPAAAASAPPSRPVTPSPEFARP